MGQITISHNDEPGDIIFCKVCGGEYELYSTNPIRLRPLIYFTEHDLYDGLEFNEDFDSF